MWRRASFKVGTIAALCAALIATVGLQVANASSGRTALSGSAATTQARAQRVGSVSKSSQVSFELVLKLHNASAANALVQAVSTPGSASFRHYLTAAQWEARFSPTKADVTKARNWLRSEGFKVGSVSADRMTISASGTAAQVEKAFGTSLALYRVRGHVVRLASSNLSVPNSVAGTVAGALGVNEYIETPAIGNPDLPGSLPASTATKSSGSGKYPPPPPAFVTHGPCSAYYAAKKTTVKPRFGHGYPKRVPDIVCGYKPPQYRSAYNVGKATGQGYKVAIVDAYDSATIVSDATKFFQKNDPGNPFSKAHFTRYDATPFTQEKVCAASSWLFEQSIDITAVHAMARNAGIVYVGAKSCLNTGLFDADQKVIDSHLADVVTNSWGDVAGDVFDDASYRAAFDNLFKMAAGTGITVMFSSGDDGDNFDLAGIAAPGYPDSSPYVTGVGGTTLKINAKGKRVGELGWATGRSFFCAKNGVGVICKKSQVGHWLPATEDGVSGGYTSYSYKEPSYQKGIVPKALALRNEPFVGRPIPLRVTPDISLDADPGTGELIGLTQTFPNGKAHWAETRYGGTSLASPLLAGFIADVDQVAGKPVGFINPAIYHLAHKAGAIMDILPEKKLQGNYRVDFASAVVPGVKGLFRSFRELYFKGPEVYCDGTGNCAKRPNTLFPAKGYDSLTGLGSPGNAFLADLAKH